MKNSLITLVFILFISLSVNAQSSIELMDIMVKPVFKPDSATGVPLPSNELNIMFKMNSAANAVYVHVLIGSAQDSGDIFTLQADIVQQNNQYFVLYNQAQNQIRGYTAQLAVALTPLQLTAYNHITLFVEDNNGQQSNRLYFKKNNQ